MVDATQERSRAGVLPLVRLEHLWVALALSIVGFFISLTPTLPNDFWWHLRAGALIAGDGLPATNIFAWTIATDAPFTYQSWLSEWLFYVLYQAGGFQLVVFARNMLGLAAFTLVAYEAQRRSGSWRLAAVVVLLAGAMTINNLTTRTQNWSWVPFTLVLIVLGRYVDGQLAPRGLALLPLIMAFWVNVHGAFVIGLLLAAAFIVGETLRRLLRQPRALTWMRLRWLYLAGGAMLAATLINPLGPGVFGYVRDLLRDTPVQTMINEWQPPTPNSLAGMFFYAGVLVLLAAFAFARRRPTISDVVLVCGLAWLAFNSARHVVWFAMAAMPIAAQCLAAPRPVFNQGAGRIAGRERGGGAVANLTVVGLLALAVIVVQPWFKPALPLPEPYRNLFVELPGGAQLFSADTPVAATEHLRAEPCAGRLFNELGYGSYLIWGLYPQAQVFIDPRVELFPLTIWQDYAQLTRGQQVPELLAQYDIACVLLDTGHQPALAAALPELAGWQRTFSTGRSEVWRRVE